MSEEKKKVFKCKACEAVVSDSAVECPECSAQFVGDAASTSTIKKLGMQKAEPTEGELHKAFMADFSKEYAKFKEAVETSWQAHNL